MTRFDPIGFLERAVATPSHEDVSAMATLLVEQLDEQGVEATVDDAGNVLATREADDPGPHVVLNTHIDTVPPHVPFEREEDVIRGRGSCDAKGPLSVLLAAFLRVELNRGQVTLAVTPDEERLSTGAAALDLDGDAFIVGEPTGLDVCNAAKGRFEAVVTLAGANAHAAEPQEGVNAVAAAGPVLEALATFDDRSDAPPVHPSLGSATLTPTIIEGGEATNQVPDECRIVVDRRSVPPETSDGFRKNLAKHLRAVIPEAVGLDVSLTERPTPFLEAFETPASDRLVGTLQEASGGDVRPFTAATEASYFATGAPTVVFGPGGLADEEGAVAHADREYVRVAEVEAAIAAVEETLQEYLR